MQRALMWLNLNGWETVQCKAQKQAKNAFFWPSQKSLTLAFFRAYPASILKVIIALPKRKIIVEEQKFPSPNVINIFFLVLFNAGGALEWIQIEIWILGFTFKPNCNFCYSKIDFNGFSYLIDYSEGRWKNWAQILENKLA